MHKILALYILIFNIHLHKAVMESVFFWWESSLWKEVMFLRQISPLGRFCDNSLTKEGIDAYRKLETTSSWYMMILAQTAK